jgi:hypothetical protein
MTKNIIIIVALYQQIIYFLSLYFLPVERLGFPEGTHHGKKTLLNGFNLHATFQSFINENVLER